MKNSRRVSSLEPFIGKTGQALCYDIIVIGASMGGFHALKQLIGEFPADLPAAVFVVLHIQPERESLLADIFGKNAKISVVAAKDRERIRKGQVYIAVPDFHLRIEGNQIRLDHGPRHNFHRPAIDALFSSAAKEYGSRVVGVVLSGALDDGTAGLMDIKRNGGMAVVQEPSDAVNPSMPSSAINCVPIDYCLPLSGMGRLLSGLAGRPVRVPMVKKEEKMPDLSTPELSTHICPECNGPMWFVANGKLLQFKCRIGHHFSGHSLLLEKTMALESALWSAVNALKDKADIATKLARSTDEKGLPNGYFMNQATQSTNYAKIITEILLGETSPVVLATKKAKKKKQSS